MDRVECGQCGAALDESASTQPEERVPCPKCSSRARSFHLFLQEVGLIEDQACAVHTREERAIGYEESELRGRSASASLDDQERLEFATVGRSSQGEEDTVSACEILALHLRMSDSGYGEVSTTVPSTDIDCVIAHRNPAKALQIQVVRAIVDPQVWHGLSRDGRLERVVTSTEAALFLKRAIELKATDKKLPFAHRFGITLALDATRLPGLTLDAVVESFRSPHGVWATTLGFASIWLIGPLPQLVWRLAP